MNQNDGNNKIKDANAVSGVFVFFMFFTIAIAFALGISEDNYGKKLEEQGLTWEETYDMSDDSEDYSDLPWLAPFYENSDK